MGGKNSKPVSETEAMRASASVKLALSATDRRPVFEGCAVEAIYFLNTILSRDLSALIVCDYWDFKFDFDEEKTFELTTKIYKTPGFSFLSKDPLPGKAADYLVWGNPEKVEAIIKSHPYVLLVKTKATDHSREFEGTLLEIALLIKDVLIIDEQGRTMAGMIEHYLRDSFGEEQVKKQKARVRPIIEEEEKASLAKRAYDLEALHAVWSVLNASTAGDAKALAEDAELIKAIGNYEKHLRTKGDWMMLVNGEELFHDQHDYFGGLGSYKNNFCEDRILGLIQVHRMRAWELQFFFTGVINFKDSTSVPRVDVRARAGFHVGAERRLGDHFSIDIFGPTASPRSPRSPGGTSRTSVNVWGKFFQAKTSSCRNYISTKPSSRKHTCPTR